MAFVVEGRLLERGIHGKENDIVLFWQSSLAEYASIGPLDFSPGSIGVIDFFYKYVLLLVF